MSTRNERDFSMTLQLELCLKHIFAKYCVPSPPKPPTEDKRIALLTPPEGASLTSEGLDAYARDTNGAPFSDETKEELIDFLDCTDDGGLTCVTFLCRLLCNVLTVSVDSTGSCKFISCRQKTMKRRHGEIW